MKELTHEEWIKNPTPRMMWVWDDDEAYKKQMKVIYIAEQAMSYPVIVVDNNEASENRYIAEQAVSYPVIVVNNNGASENRYRHCAEIAKSRRMTNKELSRWLREKPTREYKFGSTDCVFCFLAYQEIDADDEVDDILIRENDGEWREPLIEEDNTLWD